MIAATWAASLPLSGFTVLLPWRLEPALHAAVTPTQLWLIAPEAPSQELRRALRTIDQASEWSITDSLMTAPGDRLPTQLQPRLDWRPFVEFSELELQVAAFAGQRPAPLRASLCQLAERGVNERPALARLLSASALFDWAATSAEFRLRGLSFVLHESEDLAIVRGPVLPPLPGQLLDYIAPFWLPLGRGPEPRLDEDSWRLALRLDGREQALFLDDGPITVLAEDAWQSLTRSAVASSRRSPPWTK